ncbi:SDR family NAD(P)-dependent oxidoreductase [Halalkalibacter oceani]|uniref:SDR family NAD(P)-dependent oxidoreductase n=1 Tax=Halalkalibacter oceani TaxID=1653776 RepID=UPI00339282E4
MAQKVAVITGAGSGIGKATALLFAEHGATVIIADVDKEKGWSVQRKCKSRGFEALFIETDVTLPVQIQRLIEKTISQFGRIDIFMNNAGAGHPFQPIETVDEITLNQLINVNVKAPFIGCQYVIPIMKKQKKGNILFTSSMTGVRPMSGTNLYAMTKGAEITLAKALAAELAGEKIRVNVIAPVAVETPMLDKFIEDTEGTRDKVLERIPLKRLVAPEEVAKAALYLVSEDAEMMTGTVLQLDGGRGL